MAHLENKVAILTGAGSGIGRATALRFAEEGARLVLNDIEEDALGATLAQASGDEHESVVGDVSLENTAARLAETAVSRFGRIDVLVNNAGIMWIQDITDTTIEDWDRVVGINLKSMVLCAKHAIPQMLAQGGGSIVNLASISAFVGQEFGGVSTYLYNITKAGALQLTKSLASRYAKDGIRVNAIAPGATRTLQIRHFQPDLPEDEEAAIWEWAGREVTPVGRVGTPEEIAAGILHLASDESSFVTGAALVADGGFLAR